MRGVKSGKRKVPFKKALKWSVIVGAVLFVVFSGVMVYMQIKNFGGMNTEIKKLDLMTHPPENLKTPLWAEVEGIIKADWIGYKTFTDDYGTRTEYIYPVVNTGAENPQELMTVKFIVSTENPKKFGLIDKDTKENYSGVIFTLKGFIREEDSLDWKRKYRFMKFPFKTEETIMPSFADRIYVMTPSFDSPSDKWKNLFVGLGIAFLIMVVVLPLVVAGILYALYGKEGLKGSDFA